MSFRIGLGFLVLVSLCFTVKSQCSKSCDALAFYYVWQDSNLTFIGEVMGTTNVTIPNYNKDLVPSKNSVRFSIRVNVPFTCGCINGDFQGHMFQWIRSRTLGKKLDGQRRCKLQRNLGIKCRLHELANKWKTLYREMSLSWDHDQMLADIYWQTKKGLIIHSEQKKRKKR